VARTEDVPEEAKLNVSIQAAQEYEGPSWKALIQLPEAFSGTTARSKPLTARSAVWGQPFIYDFSFGSKEADQIPIALGHGPS